MGKTGSQIQGDVLVMLRGSSLAGTVTGGVYRDGMRPRGSRLEDIVVAFTAGIPGQIHEGVVTVNVYVPDITPFSDGVYVKDGERCEVLECMAQEWVDSLTADRSDYVFSLENTIHTLPDRDTDQHFVVVRLKYRLCNI